MLSGLTRRDLLIAAPAAYAASASAKAGQPIRIGLLAELSGKFAAYGVPSRRGAEMALDAVNHTVAGQPVELVVRDTQSDPQVTVAAMAEFAGDQKLAYLLGPTSTPTVDASIPTWLQYKPLWIVAAASDTSIEPRVGKEPHFFHTYPYAYDYHISMSAALRSHLGPGRKVAVIYTDGAFGRNHIGFVRKYYPEAGFDITAEQLVPQNAIDMQIPLQKIKRTKPDILIALTETTDAITLAKQAQIARLGVPYMVGTSFAQYVEWQHAVGAAQDGWIGLTMYVPDGVHRAADPQNPALFPATADWDRMFRSRYQSEPDQLAAASYASTAVLLFAMQQAGGGADPERVAAELRKLRVTTLVGPCKFESTPGGTLQQAFAAMSVFQRQNGRSVVLYPPDVANGKLLPMTWTT